MVNSIKRNARIGGILYLIIIVAGIFAEAFVRSKLMVSEDASATAVNIRASEHLWRLGFAVSLVMLICDVIVTQVLYMLLKPVSKNLALLSTLFRLVSIGVLALNLVNHFAALFPLGSSAYLKAFEPAQLHALAYLSLKAFSAGYNVSLVFFGIHCFVLGYLIFRSKFLPGALGILLIICALCYVTNSFAWFLVPKFAAMLFPGILLPCLIAELALCGWLIVRGVDVPRWEHKIQELQPPSHF